MIARKLKEAIEASRKAAREFERALQDLGQQLARNNRPGRPVLQPIPIPVEVPRQKPSPGYWNQFAALTNMAYAGSATRLLAARLTRMLGLSRIPSFAAFSNRAAISRAASIIRLAQCSEPAVRRAFFAPGRTSFGATTNAARAVIYRVQPFRSAFRPRFGGCPNALYANFTRHNARMYSTFGPDVAAQAVQNLSQGIRAFFIKGAQMKAGGNNGDGCASTPLAFSASSSCQCNDTYVDRILALNRNDPSINTQLESQGCYIEFNLSSSSVGAKSLPQACFLDEDMLSDLRGFISQRVRYQTQVMRSIELLKERMGSPGGRRCTNSNGDILLRFYFPDCAPSKMESLLIECGITTATIHEYMPSNGMNDDDENCDDVLSTTDTTNALESETDWQNVLTDTASDSAHSYFISVRG